MATDNFAAPPEAHESTTATEAAGTPPAAVPAAPQSVSAAEAAAIELPSSPPPAFEPPHPSMSVVQDAPTPSLPERPGPLPRESSLPSARSAPTVDPDQPTEIPEIASLKAMFPDFDGAVLQSVLESCGGDQDRAIDMLLGMSDPDYVSQNAPAPVQSQTDLDEEYARQLMLEDQQHQERQQQSGGRGQPGYVSRARGQQWQPQQQPQQQPATSPGGQRDGLADLQEQVAKFADTGKKTFSSLLTKAKAKLQEFDQQRTGQSSAQAGTQPSWGDQQYEAPAQSYGQASAHAQAQPSYYDPNPQPTRQDSFASTQGYDTTPLPSSQAPHSAAPPIGSAPSVAALSTTAVAGSAPTTPAVTTPRPPSTSSGAPPIDPGKLGMLPKRPVSLLRDPSQPPARHDDDDDDELEYAENPFEEHR